MLIFTAYRDIQEEACLQLKSEFLVEKNKI